MTHNFFSKGWYQFAFDQTLADWVAQALPFARATVTASENAQWHRCGGTWFAGVNVLPNDPRGTIGNSGPLQGKAIDFVRDTLALDGFDWDTGQISICYPGYPQPMASESESAFSFRHDRDAAHVDGLLPEGSERRRHLREHHGFILGIPMVEFSKDASPFVVWEGSHEVIRTAMQERFKNIPPHLWGDEDVTDIYQQTRRTVFDVCKRVEIHAKPGEAFITHRLLVHGMAKWGESAEATDDGRMICYFRPEFGDPHSWLMAP